MSEGEELALVPFNAASPFHNPRSLKERCFDFAGHQICVKQNWIPDGKGGTHLGFGAAVYEAAYLLVDFLTIHTDLLDGKSIVELGCGVGLVSIACAKFGACSSVLATDGDETSVALTLENCQVNNVNRLVNAQHLEWAEELSPQLGQFDVILGSDIVCFPYREHFQKLFKTLLSLSRPGTTVLISHKPRDPSEAEFLSDLSNSGQFRLVRRIPPEQLHSSFLHEDISIYHFRRRA